MTTIGIQLLGMKLLAYRTKKLYSKDEPPVHLVRDQRKEPNHTGVGWHLTNHYVNTWCGLDLLTNNNDSPVVEYNKSTHREHICKSCGRGFLKAKRAHLEKIRQANATPRSDTPAQTSGSSG